MDRAYSILERDSKFSTEYVKRINPVGDLGLGERIRLKWIFMSALCELD
jgi:hypothetical protein